MTRAPTIYQFHRSFGTFKPVAGRWQGDSYRYHPHGVIARPMIYTDHHHVDGHCDAKVMTDPQSPIKPIAVGRDASIHGSGGCNPIPERGALVMVYRNGAWIGPDGPWRQRMRDDMAAVLREIRAINRAERLEDRRKRAEAEQSRADAFKAAERAFAD